MKLLHNQFLKIPFLCKFFRYIGRSFIAPILAFCVAFFIVGFTSHDFFGAVKHFLFAIFSSQYYFGTFLSMVGLFALAGLGARFSLITHNINLGGEGQIYLGGFIGTVILLSFPQHYFSFFIALAVVIFISALVGFISAYLKIIKNMNVLLSSFLLSAAIIPIIDYAITVYFRDSSSNLLSTKPIPLLFVFSSLLEPSSFNISFFISLFLVIATFLYLKYTVSGNIFTVSGLAPSFIEYSGFSSVKIMIVSLVFSSILHGLTGFFAVLGVYKSCPQGFYSSYGWNALSVALIAGQNPLGIIPASIFFAYIFIGIQKVSLSSGLAFDFGYLIQAVMFLVVALPKTSVYYQKNRKKQ